MSDIVEDLRYAEHVTDERVMRVMDAGADIIESLRQQLAASQAIEQNLLEALYGAKWVIKAVSKISSLDYAELIKQMEEALALPQDTSALESMIAKAGELMRNQCVYAADNPLWETEEAIRSLPPITLKDLE